MDISNSFDLTLDPDSAWSTLLDIERIMPCIPGAELTEASADGSYKGKVSVKLGPVALTFVGTAAFAERDDGARGARLKAKGTDSKGRGGVQADMSFHVIAVGSGSRVAVLTQLSLTGAVAQYGRGVGIIQGVASQLIAQFASNLEASLSAARIASAQVTPAAALPDAPTVQQAPPGPSPTAHESAAKPVSGLSLLLKVLWNQLLGLFRKQA